jgi:hypothetical protein
MLALSYNGRRPFVGKDGQRQRPERLLRPGPEDPALPHTSDLLINAPDIDLGHHHINTPLKSPDAVTLVIPSAFWGARVDI